jgi:hypothetical protein
MKFSIPLFVSRGILILSFLTIASCSAPSPSPTALPTSTPTPAATVTFTPSQTPMTSSPTPAPTLAEPFFVRTFCTLIGQDKNINAPSNAPITLLWGWDAKTEAQINDFLASNITTITLDGNVITATKQSPIQKVEKTGNFEVVWSADVGLLTPGQHPMVYDLKFKKTVEDGTNTYGPGSKNETEHDECVIIVK